MNFWTCGGDDTHAPQNGNWPGDNVTQTKSVAGKNWFYKTFTLNSDDDFVNFVFSTGNGSPQTVDIENVRTDKFFLIVNEQEGGKYKVSDVTGDTGIPVFTTPTSPSSSYIFTLDGRRVNTTTTDGLPRGIYVKDGKKIVVK